MRRIIVGSRSLESIRFRLKPWRILRGSGVHPWKYTWGRLRRERRWTHAISTRAIRSSNDRRPVRCSRRSYRPLPRRTPEWRSREGRISCKGEGWRGWSPRRRGLTGERRTLPIGGHHPSCFPPGSSYDNGRRSRRYRCDNRGHRRTRRGARYIRVLRRRPPDIGIASFRNRFLYARER